MPNKLIKSEWKEYSAHPVIGPLLQKYSSSSSDRDTEQLANKIEAEIAEEQRKRRVANAEATEKKIRQDAMDKISGQRAPRGKAITSIDEIEFPSSQNEESQDVADLIDALGDHDQQVRDLNDALSNKRRPREPAPFFDLRPPKSKKDKKAKENEPWLRSHKLQVIGIILTAVGIVIAVYINFIRVKPDKPMPNSPSGPTVMPKPPVHPQPKLPDVWNKKAEK